MLGAEDVSAVKQQRRIRSRGVLHVQMAGHGGAEFADRGVGLALGVLARVQRSLIGLIVDDKHANTIRNSLHLGRDSADSARMFEYGDQADATHVDKFT